MQVATKSERVADAPVRPLLDGLMSAAEVCRQLQKSRYAIWRWERAGAFVPATKVGATRYYEVAAVRAWLETRAA